MIFVSRWSLTAFLTCLLLSAAEPVEGPHPECGGAHISSKAKDGDLLPRRGVALPGAFCSAYTFAGWEQPMDLYLGEGSYEHLDAVKAAIAIWNSALEGFRGDFVVRLVEDLSPRNSTLEPGFWDNAAAVSESNVADGQSVIYFKPAGQLVTTEDFEDVRGFARLRPEHGRMHEADIYINTRLETEHGSTLAETSLILQSQSGLIHALVDPLHLVIAHELGHALGLAHVPISGNIMSYNYMPAMQEKWLAAAEFLEYTFHVLDQTERLQYLVNSEPLPPMVRLTTEWEFYLRSVYTKSVGIGEQDRMALMCIYDFEDWNH